MYMRLRKSALGVLMVLVTTLLAPTASATEYTLALPASVEGYWLCQLDVVALDTRQILGVMSYDDTAPPPEGMVLHSGGNVEYTAVVVDRGGVPTLVVEGDVENRLSVDAGFCRTPEDPDALVMDFIRVTELLEGGSPGEDDRAGTYDGIGNIWVDICTVPDAFEVSQQINAAFGEATLSHLGTDVAQNRFETIDDDHAYTLFYLANYPNSLRDFADAAAPALENIDQFEFIYGNRILAVSNCETQGLWIRVVGSNDVELWSDFFTGFRLLAARQDAGNIFITFAAGTDAPYINIVGVDGPGQYRIGPAPDDDTDDPAAIPYGIAHYGGTAGMPNAARSVSGSVWITANDPATGISGFFEFSAEDGETGEPRTVSGGFRNLPVR